MIRTYGPLRIIKLNGKEIYHHGLRFASVVIVDLIVDDHE